MTGHNATNHWKLWMYAGRMATVVALVAITALAFLPNDVQVMATVNDKTKHILAFMVLAAGLRGFWLWSHAQVALVLLAYGIAIECVQYVVPGRFASVGDVVADAVGIACGLVLGELFRKAMAKLCAKPAP